MGTSYECEMAQKQFLPYQMGYLTDWMVQLAKEELGETEENRRQGLSELRKLIAKDKQLDIWTDDVYLLQFLRARKFNPKRAFELLHHFYVVKRDYPEVFPIETNIGGIKDIINEANPGGPFPYRDKNGSSIFYFKIGNWDPDQFPLSVALSALAFALLQCIEDPATQVCGMHVLVDAEGISLKQIRCVTPRYLQLISKALRIHFHGSNMKHLQKYIPKEILPPEYDGDNIHYCAKDCFKKEMFPFFERFSELHRKGFQ